MHNKVREASNWKGTTKDFRIPYRIKLCSIEADCDDNSVPKPKAKEFSFHKMKFEVHKYFIVFMLENLCENKNSAKRIGEKLFEEFELMTVCLKTKYNLFSTRITGTSRIDSSAPQCRASSKGANLKIFGAILPFIGEILTEFHFNQVEEVFHDS